MKTKVIALIFALLILAMPAAASQALKVEMQPLQYKNVEVKVREVGSLDIPRDLEDDYYVTVQITKLTEPGEEAFEQFFFINGSENKKTLIPFTPGRYSVDGMLIWDKNITTLEDTREYCKGVGGTSWEEASSSVGKLLLAQGIAYAGGLIFTQGALAAMFGAVMGPVGWIVSGLIIVLPLIFECIGKLEEVIIPPVNLPQVPSGGVSIGEETGHYWRLTQTFLSSHDTITFYVFKFPPPLRIEDFALMSAHEELSKQYPHHAKPS